MEDGERPSSPSSILHPQSSFSFITMVMLITATVCGQVTRPSSRPGGEVVPPPRRDVPGYTAVRDLIRIEKGAARVSDVVLLDSLYAPRMGANKDGLDPAAMAPFVAFARRAAAADGDATFLFSHLYPPQEQYRGNTTTLAASFLIDALALERQDAIGRNSRGAALLYRAEKGNCHILGYGGMTNQDHFDHFYAAADLLKLTSLSDADRPSR